MHAAKLRNAVACALFLLGATAHGATPLSYIGQQIVPTGTMAFGTTVGGLSGIDYDAAGSRYFAISDDRSQIDAARFYQLGLDLNQFRRSSTPGLGGVAFQSVTTLLTPAGSAFAAGALDPEAIRYDGANLYWTSEGARDASGLQAPFVRRMSTLGVHRQELAVPNRFIPTGSVPGTAPGDSGIRNNLSLESLTLSSDRSRLYAATENALVQDGPAAAVGQSSVSRVIELALASGSRMAEYAYVVDPVGTPPVPSGAFANNGLVEMLAIGERQFITVERSFSTGVGNGIRLYYADARGATDIAGIDSLVGATYTPMSKRLLLDLATLRNDDGSAVVLDNIEGITFGPVVDGKPTLLLVADNNFSATQLTQFIALAQVGPIPEPETYALMLAGLVLVLAAYRRRT